MASLKKWRLWHRYILGYYRGVILMSTVVVILLSVSGILLEHKSDWRFMQTGRIPAGFLPEKYTQRLLETRRQQRLDSSIGGAGIPLSWVIYDLHTGTFFGEWALYYYDLVAGALIVLGITGSWMMIVITKRKKGP